MLALTPLTSHSGCEISNLDVLQALDPTICGALLRALDTHGLVLLRAPPLTAQQFLAFSHGLGELAVDTRQRANATHDPALTVLSNIFENGVPDTVHRWRLESAHLKTPHRATVTYAAEITSSTDTAQTHIEFANTAAAYDALEPTLRAQLTGMRAVHPYGGGRKRRDAPYFADSGLTRIFRSGVEHPVVRTHPRSGRKCLYVSPATTSHIHGMHERDSDALLAQLYEHLARPEFVYRHAWRAGDLLLWDNSMMQYRGNSDNGATLGRLFYRALLKG